MGICIPEDSVEYCSLKTRTCMGEATVTSHIICFMATTGMLKKKKRAKRITEKKKKETPNKN